MQKKKISEKRNKKSTRVLILSAISIAVMLIYALDLVSVQLVHGDEYAASIKSLDKYTLSVSASRGEIFDRNGKPLVSNRTGYSLSFNLSYFPPLSEQAKRNEIILSLINYLESKQEAWIDALPLVFDLSGKITFLESKDSEIEYMKSAEMLNMNYYATAENCFNAIVEKYSLKDYSPADARKIASVCYSLRHMGFSVSSPYTFAQDVSIETAAYIKENSDFYKGVGVEISTYREYTDGTLAVHLLGNIGMISAGELSAKKSETETALKDTSLTETEKTSLKLNDYKLNDTIGKSGVEQAMEKYLRGKVGSKTITIDIDGSISEEQTIKPETGNTVIMTIDSELQRVAQNALSKRIRELTGGYGLVAAGAVVVIDVNNGDILASASYPSFDLNKLSLEYNTISALPGAPLWNRAMQSTYEPGSTMKPGVALAALETGVINSSTIFYCNKKFQYKDHEFGCLGTHGGLNVVSAIDYSCNIFFYNVADILGITKMNAFSALFGLGSKTGVEIPEANGILAGVAYSDSIGREWVPGDTLQSAVGQSYNQFTPLQLANYCAVIANNGTRYVPHLIKSVKSADYSKSILDKEAEVVVDTEIAQSSFDIVKQGMYRVANSGTCREAFQTVPVKAAAKTGTSQTKKLVNGEIVNGNNGFLISFAPYENSEIAVAVVIENVDQGSATANVAADIYNYYFNRTTEMEKNVGINELIS